MTNESGPGAAAKGTVEDLKGKAKEALGTVAGDEEKAQEGRAQQRKAEAERDVAEHEAKAAAARGKAAGHEVEQESHQ